MRKIFVFITSFMLSAMTFMSAEAQTATATSAQTTQPRLFSLEDINFGGVNYHKFVPENRWTTWWGDELIRLDAEYCSVVDKNTGKEKKLLTAAQLKKDGLTVHSFYSALFPEAGKTIVILTAGNQTVAYNWKSHRVLWAINLASGTQASSFCYASRSLAYVKDWQLYVAQPSTGSKTEPVNAVRKLTTDGSRNIVYGQSVHRDEFGIDGGLFWSPDGKKLAFYRMDQSMVTDYPQVDIPDPEVVPDSGSRIATYAPDKYPMAGETSHKVTLGVYDLTTQKLVYLKAGDPTDRYFTNVAWSPDSKTIYMFELNRDQNDCRLVSYDATTGDKLKELYRETDNKYVEPLHPIMFLPWDSQKFIMQSQKDGYNHFYLFDTTGKELKQITSGKWVVEDFLGFDTKHKALVYESNECSPIQRNIWVVDVATGKRALMDDNGKGWHTGSLSGSGQYIVDNYSAPTTPRNIAIVNTDNGRRTRWLTAADPWKGYDVPEYRCGTIKAADGVTDLYYRMVMPINFDPKKKYPTIIYVYGGPHAHNVDARWHYCSRSWETYMAQRGYLLFILDNRGSENRGKAFEQVTFRHLGDHEVEDQMKGVDFLKSLAYVDSTRLGVHGWSFGGFMTINMMTTHPGVFKVGVAGGPVIDWKWYEVMYGERYMDTPQTNPEGYAHSSLLPKAKNLKDRLEIIIGGNDATVVPQHALSFLKECIKYGTQPDFFVYPGEPHNMRGHQSVHLHERISRYFFDFLK
jgi:dipeptidyl-peptidase-4